jgi:hypothetical protein
LQVDDLLAAPPPSPARSATPLRSPAIEVKSRSEERKRKREQNKGKSDIEEIADDKSVPHPELIFLVGTERI